MLGKTYAMEVVQEYVNHAETIMKYGELYFDDSPDDWKDRIRHQIRTTLDILGTEYKLEDVSYNGRELTGFLIIVRGWGERGAQLRYENHGYETSMRFNTIIDGNRKGVTVTLENNGKTGFLDYHGDKSKQIRTWPCEM